MLKKSSDEALAVALKVDGQVDAYQVTNKFLAVTKDGHLKNKFLPTKASEGHRANGMLEAVENGFNNVGWNWDYAKSKYVE